MKSHAAHILKMRRTALATSAIRTRVQFSPSGASSLLRPATAGFHTSPYLRNGQGSQLPQSPFKVFVQTLKEELQKNRELQDNVKQLQGDVDKLADSEAMKKAREAYEKARVSLPIYDLYGVSRELIDSPLSQLRSSLENNPRLKAAADEMKKAGLKISDGVAEAMKAVEESELMRNVRR